MERVRHIARDGTTLILITHHVEEIIPEIGRVILLRNGRIAADGAKRDMLTEGRLSDAFDGRDERGGKRRVFFRARPCVVRMTIDGGIMFKLLYSRLPWLP